MDETGRTRIEVEFSRVSKGWAVKVVWPERDRRAPVTYGPYDDLEAAKTGASGLALRLTEEGNSTPPIILLAGALWEF